MYSTYLTGRQPVHSLKERYLLEARGQAGCRESMPLSDHSYSTQSRIRASLLRATEDKRGEDQASGRTMHVNRRPLNAPSHE